MRDIKLHYWVLFVSAFLLMACTNSSKKMNVPPFEVLHDNSSKVWILKSQFENEIDKTPYNRLDKWMITFYNDKTFVLTTLGHFADYSLHQGSFKFNEDNSILYYDWLSGQVDENEIVLIDKHNLIYLFPQTKEITLKMHFVPMDKMKAPVNVDL